jgi:hypothetical protein
MQLAGHVDGGVAAVGHDLAAVHDHVPHVGGGCREDGRLERVVRLGPGEADAVQSHRHEVRPRAHFDPPGVGPAQARVPVGGRGAQELGRAVAAALPARKALVQLDHARLLEEVDHRVRVAPE